MKNQDTEVRGESRGPHKLGRAMGHSHESREMTADRTPPSCQLLTVRKVACLLSLHPRTIWRLAGLAEAGLDDFPKPIRLAAKTVRWRLRDIEGYLARLAGEGDHGDS